ncbi:alpha-mannosidase [Treponema sp. OttesenSCG-928-L16]|nr:alpha-mannosidase [Treponema sp. OttesenSCG-928-L16]
MYFQFERIQRICDMLKNQVYSHRVPIEQYQFTEGNFKGLEDIKNRVMTWQSFKSGYPWGGRDVHGWFKTGVEIPAEFAGRTAVLYFRTFDEGFDAVNPQFILYINGEMKHGLDINHREAVLAKDAVPGSRYEIDLHAYAGMLQDKKCSLFGELAVLEEEVRGLYFDIQVPLWSCERLDKEDKKRIDMLAVLNEGINKIDFREPYSADYYSSIKEARDFLRDEFYGKLCGYDEVTALCVGHTHIDVAWLWTVAQTREKVTRSFSTVLDLMERYGEYIFMSSQPQLYQFMKEDHPELYAKVKERIAEGRWEGEGAMWLEADCNISSGESLVRQLLHGKRFFKDEFGIDSKILWIPDVFGYSAALPQILKKAGVDYFITSKISWNQFNRIPNDTFMWRGIDGTEILSYFITAKTPYQEKGRWYATYNTVIHPGSLAGAWDDYKQKDINNEILIPFGYGDGGGGPTLEMLETARRMSAGIPGSPKVKMGTSLDFFKRLEERVRHDKRLPLWAGELYLEYHRGTYTSMARNKRDNRKAEYLYQNAEKVNALAMLMGKAYPQAEFDQGWKKILLNQFHDILPGSSIKEVYDVTAEEYKQILTSGRTELEGGLRYIASFIPVMERSLMVYNPLSFERDDIAEFEIPGDIANPVLVCPDGSVLPCQLIGGGKALCYVPGIPANGYKFFVLRDQEESGVPHSPDAAGSREIRASREGMENEFFRIRFDANMNITSLYDKVKRREVLKGGTAGNQLQAFEDIPMKYDNWDIDIFYSEKMWNVNDVQDAELIERGPVRYTVRIRRKFSTSLIEQRIQLYRDIPRIDFAYTIDWRQSQVLLKAAFPVDINAVEASYDIQYGNVKRPAHRNTSWDAARFEVCGHKWADVSEGSYGVSLLNESKYGYDIQDSVMRLTLIKSGVEPNPQTDQEVHEFVYSLYPHQGGWQEGGTHKMACRLNVPLVSIAESVHGGTLPASYSFASTDADNVMIEVIKKAEDNDDIIIRLYEYENARTETKLNLGRSFRELYECDLLENPLEKIGTDTDAVSFVMKPYEIKTLRLRHGL